MKFPKDVQCSRWRKTQTILSRNIKMKVIYYHIYNIFALSLMLFSLGCRHNSNTIKVEGSFLNAKERAENIIQERDTAIGPFHVHYKLIELLNDSIIKVAKLSTNEQVSLTYHNRIVEIDLQYEDKSVLTKKISKDDFLSIIPKNNLKEYQIWNFYIEDVSSDNITFSFSICVPDTDNCYSILYKVSKIGEIQISEEEIEWEE